MERNNGRKDIKRQRERYGKRQKEVNKMRDKSDIRKRQSKKTKVDRNIENDNYTQRGGKS